MTCPSPLLPTTTNALSVNPRSTRCFPTSATACCSAPPNSWEGLGEGAHQWQHGTRPPPTNPHPYSGPYPEAFHQCIIQPPSISIIWPVMKEEASLARKVIRLPMSSAVPRRFNA